VRVISSSQTANLVLNAAEGRRRDTGPSGEVASLVGKGKDVRDILKTMGSRVSFSRPADAGDAGKKKRKQDDDGDDASQARRNKKVRRPWNVCSS